MCHRESGVGVGLHLDTFLISFDRRLSGCALYDGDYSLAGATPFVGGCKSLCIKDLRNVVWLLGGIGCEAVLYKFVGGIVISTNMYLAFERGCGRWLGR